MQFSSHFTSGSLAVSEIYSATLRQSEKAAASVAHLPYKRWSSISVPASDLVALFSKCMWLNETLRMEASTTCITSHQVISGVCNSTRYQTTPPLSLSVWHKHRPMHAHMLTCILIHAESAAVLHKSNWRKIKIKPIYDDNPALNTVIHTSGTRGTLLKSVSSRLVCVCGCIENVWKIAHAACRVAACLH